jgi:hypothetical protein
MRRSLVFPFALAIVGRLIAIDARISEPEKEARVLVAGGSNADKNEFPTFSMSCSQLGKVEFCWLEISHSSLNSYS